MVARDFFFLLGFFLFAFGLYCWSPTACLIAVGAVFMWIGIQHGGVVPGRKR